MTAAVLTPQQKRKFSRKLSLLKRHAPVGRIVRVVVGKPDRGNWAQVEETPRKRGFVVTLHEEAVCDMRLELLVHEWAHMLTWETRDTYTSTKDFDAHWGLAYARCYRIVFGNH